MFTRTTVDVDDDISTSSCSTVYQIVTVVAPFSNSARRCLLKELVVTGNGINAPILPLPLPLGNCHFHSSLFLFSFPFSSQVFLFHPVTLSNLNLSRIDKYSSVCNNHAERLTLSLAEVAAAAKFPVLLLLLQPFYGRLDSDGTIWVSRYQKVKPGR